MGEDQTQPLLGSGQEPLCTIHVEDKSARTSKGWRDEACRLMKLAIPISLTQALTYTSHMITVAQVGRLGSIELSAMALAQTVFNITGLSLVIGCGSAIETFSGQAFGAQQHELLGIILQRATLMCWLTAVFPLAVWTQADQLMRLLGQSPQLSGPASGFIQIAAAMLPLDALRTCLGAYLSTQNIVLPLAAVSLLCTIAVPFLNILFMYLAGLGLNGVAVGGICHQLLAVLLLVGIAMWHNHWQPPNLKPWRGFSSEAFHNWGPYLKVAIPSTAMICLDWWAFEVMTLIAGMLPDATTAVGAVGICFGLHVMVFFLVSGIGAAVSIRVSNELGAANPGAVTLILRTAVGLALVLAGLLTLPMWVYPGSTARIFSKDPEVVRTVVACMPALLLSLLGDSISNVLAGAVRGAGKQAQGFAVNLGAYWLVGLPLAAVAALKLGYGAPGMWWVMVGVSLLAAVLLTTLVCFFDWEHEVLRSQTLVRSQSSRLVAADRSSSSIEGQAAEVGA